jgi:hypothetical protein
MSWKEINSRCDGQSQRSLALPALGDLLVDSDIWCCTNCDSVFVVVDHFFFFFVEGKCPTLGGKYMHGNFALCGRKEILTVNAHKCSLSHAFFLPSAQRLPFTYFCFFKFPLPSFLPLSSLPQISSSYTKIRFSSPSHDTQHSYGSDSIVSLSRNNPDSGNPHPAY